MNDEEIVMRKLREIAARSHENAPIGLKALLFDEIYGVILEYDIKRHEKRLEEESKW